MEGKEKRCRERDERESNEGGKEVGEFEGGKARKIG